LEYPFEQVVGAPTKRQHENTRRRNGGLSVAKKSLHTLLVSLLCMSV
jgi:hypothetical protein